LEAPNKVNLKVPGAKEARDIQMADGAHPLMIMDVLLWTAREEVLRLRVMDDLQGRAREACHPEDLLNKDIQNHDEVPGQILAMEAHLDKIRMQSLATMIEEDTARAQSRPYEIILDLLREV
jgi:hypothetical protein